MVFNIYLKEKLLDDAPGYNVLNLDHETIWKEKSHVAERDDGRTAVGGRQDQVVFQRVQNPREHLLLARDVHVEAAHGVFRLFRRALRGEALANGDELADNVRELHLERSVLADEGEDAQDHGANRLVLAVEQ